MIINNGGVEISVCGRWGTVQGLVQQELGRRISIRAIPGTARRLSVSEAFNIILILISHHGELIWTMSILLCTSILYWHTCLCCILNDCPWFYICNQYLLISVNAASHIISYHTSYILILFSFIAFHTGALEMRKGSLLYLAPREVL